MTKCYYKQMFNVQAIQGSGQDLSLNGTKITPDANSVQILLIVLIK